MPGPLRQLLELATHADTKGVDQMIGSLDRLDGAGTKSESALKKVSTATNLLGAAVAGGIVAEMGRSVKVAGDFEKSLQAVASATGVTDAELSDLRKTALQVGKDTSLSASESVAAFGELAKAGVDVRDIIAGVGKTTVQLAEATGKPVEQMATLLADTRSIWKLSTQGVSDAADTMARAAAASTIDIGDLQAAISNVGPVAANLGLSVRDTSVALGILGNNGIKGAEAGTALRGMLLRLTAPTNEAAAALDTLGVNVFDANGNMRQLPAILGDLDKALAPLSQEERTGIMKTIFDSYTITAGSILIGDATNKFSEFNAAIDKSPGVAKQAEDRLKGLAGQMEKLKGSIETLEIGLGTILLPTITRLAERATGVVDALIEFQDALAAGDPKAKALAETLKVVAAALAGLFIINALIGPITTIVNTISTLYSLGSKTISIGVDLAETGYLHFLEFQDKLNAAKDRTIKIATEGADKARDEVQKIVDALEKLKDKTFSVKGDIPADDLASKGATAGEKAAQGAASGFANVFGALVGTRLAASSAGTLITRGIAAGMQAASGAVSSLMASPVGLIVVGIIAALAAAFLIYKNRERIAEFLGPILEGIGAFFSETVPAFLTETVPAALAKIPGIIANALADAGGWVGDSLAPIGDAVRSFFTETVPRFFTDTIPEAFAQVPGLMKKGAEGLAFALGAALAIAFVAIPVLLFRLHREAAEKGLEGLGWLVDNIGPMLAKIPGALADLAGRLAEAAGTAFGAAWDAISTAITEWPGDAWEFFVAIADRLRDLGGDLAGAAADAFGAAWVWMISDDGPKSWPGKAWEWFLDIAAKLVALDVRLVDAISHAFGAAWNWAISDEGPRSWPGRAWEFFVAIAQKLFELDQRLGDAMAHSFGVAWTWAIGPDGPRSWPDKAWTFFLAMAGKLDDLGPELLKAASSAFGAAWGWISGPDGPRSWPEKIVALLSGLATALENVARGALRAFSSVWDGLGGVLSGPINLGIDIINGFIRGINAVLRKLGGAVGDLQIGEIPRVGQSRPTGGGPTGDIQFDPGFATGGEITRPTRTTIGEEAPRFREWVITENPAHRASNLEYLKRATDALAGPVPHLPMGFGPGDLVPDVIEDAIGSVADWVRQGAVALVNKIAAQFEGLLPGTDSIGGSLVRGGFATLKNAFVGVVQGGLDTARNSASAGNMGRPLSSYVITQGFGENPQIYGPGGHTGIDLVGPHLASVMATAFGDVTHAGFGMGGYGNAVMLAHANGVASLYGHLSETLRSVGSAVMGGDIIGRQGWTGFVMPEGPGGEHLHFEIRAGGTPVNPRNFVSFAAGGINSKWRLLVDPRTGQATGQISENDQPEAIIPLGSGIGGGIGGNVTPITSSISGDNGNGTFTLTTTIHALGVFGLLLEKVNDEFGEFIAHSAISASVEAVVGNLEDFAKRIEGIPPQLLDAINNEIRMLEAARNPASPTFGMNLQEIFDYLRSGEASQAAATEATQESAAAVQSAASAFDRLTVDQRAAFNAQQRLIQENTAELARLRSDSAILRDTISAGGPVAGFFEDLLAQNDARAAALEAANRIAQEKQNAILDGFFESTNQLADVASNAADTAHDAAQVSANAIEGISDPIDNIEQSAAEMGDAAEVNADNMAEFGAHVDDFGNIVDEAGEVLAPSDHADQAELEARRRAWERDHPGEPAPFAGGSMLTRPTLLMDAATRRIYGLAAEQGPEPLLSRGAYAALIDRAGRQSDTTAGYVDRSVTHNYLVPSARELERRRQESYTSRRFAAARRG